jgi:hypothetical protein
MNPLYELGKRRLKNYIRVFHRLGPKVSHIISTHIIHYSKLVTQSNLNARVLGSIAFHILKKEEFEKKFVSA